MANLLLRRHSAEDPQEVVGQMPLSPTSSYVDLISRSCQPRCTDNMAAGRLVLAMLMHPRLGEDCVAVSSIEHLEDPLRLAGEKIRRFVSPKDLFRELGRRKSCRGALAHTATFWRLDDQDKRLVQLVSTCDVDGSDTAGFTPLYRATSNGDATAVEILCQGSASLNGIVAANSWGFTPLMEAARNCNVQMVELLLRLGARKDAIDARGRTARQIARLATSSLLRCNVPRSDASRQRLDDMLSL